MNNINSNLIVLLRVWTLGVNGDPLINLRDESPANNNPQCLLQGRRRFVTSKRFTANVCSKGRRFVSSKIFTA